MNPENNNSTETVTIVGLLGSLRSNSFTQQAIEIALKGAKDYGAETVLIKLQEFNLPFCDGGNNYPSDVHKLRKIIKDADGIIIGTPEYHGSFSGVLKNAIDLMGFNEFEGKMVGLLGVAGGITGAINSLNMLRVVVRQLRAWVVPHQVSIAQSNSAFNKENELINEMLQTRTLELGQKVAKFAFLHTSNRIQEFLKEWETSVINPVIDYYGYDKSSVHGH